MQRVAFRLWVKPDRLAEYKDIHQRVWPELLRDMHDAGIRNYTIFADGNELFGYLECDDWYSTLKHFRTATRTGAGKSG